MPLNQTLLLHTSEVGTNNKLGAEDRAPENKVSVCNSTTGSCLSMIKKLHLSLAKRGWQILSEEKQCYNSLPSYQEQTAFLQSRLCRGMGKPLPELMAFPTFLRQQHWHEKQEQCKSQLLASSRRVGQFRCYRWDLLPSAVTGNRHSLADSKRAHQDLTSVLVLHLYNVPALSAAHLKWIFTSQTAYRVI